MGDHGDDLLRVLCLVAVNSAGINTLSSLRLTSKYIAQYTEFHVNKLKHLKKKYNIRFILAVWRKLIRCPLTTTKATYTKVISIHNMAIVRNLLHPLYNTPIAYRYQYMPLLTNLHIIMRSDITFYYAVLWNHDIIHLGAVYPYNYYRVADTNEEIGGYSIASERYIADLDIPLLINPIPITDITCNHIQLILTPTITTIQNGTSVIHDIVPDLDFCLEFLYGIIINYKFTASDTPFEFHANQSHNMYKQSLSNRIVMP